MNTASVTESIKKVWSKIPSLLIYILVFAAMLFVNLEGIVKGAFNLLGVPVRGVATVLKADYDKVVKENADFKQNYIPIDSARALAKSLSTTKQDSIDVWVKRYNLETTISSSLKSKLSTAQSRILELEKQGFKPTDVSFGSGQDSIRGDIVVNLADVAKGKDTTQDDWLNLRLKTNGDLLGINYSFGFEVFDAAVTYTDDTHNKVTQYSVGIRSLRNPKKQQFLSGYKREEIHLKPGLTVFRWWDPKINLDIYPLAPNGLSGGLAITIVSIAFGDRQDDVLATLPSFGLTSNIDGASFATVGLRFNAGHFLPLFTDLHVVFVYAFPIEGDTGRRILIGIGTTL
jgi:hypothetical protein